MHRPIHSGVAHVVDLYPTIASPTDGQNPSPQLSQQFLESNEAIRKILEENFTLYAQQCSKLKDAQSESESLATRIKILEQEKQECSEQNSITLGIVQAKVGDLEKELSEKEKSISSLGDELNTRGGSIVELDQKVSQLSRQLDECEKDRNSQKEMSAELREENIRLEKELESRQIDIERLVEESTERKKLCNKAVWNFVMTEQARDTLYKHHRALEKSFAQLTEKIIQSNLDKGTVQGESQQLEDGEIFVGEKSRGKDPKDDQIEKLQNEKQELIEQNIKLAEKNKGLQRDDEKKRERIDTLSSSLKEKNKVIEFKARYITQLEGKKRELNGSLDQAERDKKNLEADKLELRAQLMRKHLADEDATKSKENGRSEPPKNHDSKSKSTSDTGHLRHKRKRVSITSASPEKENRKETSKSDHSPRDPKRQKTVNNTQQKTENPLLRRNT